MKLKQILIYGGLTGVLLLLLEVTQYRTALRDISTEFFGVLVAIIFLVLGIWIGLVLHQRKSLEGKYEHQKLGLSDREMDVLKELSMGHSNQEIADNLFVSLNTVKTHISRIYQKLNAKRRTQAVQRAIELKIISPPNE